ncbi:hypothetical protein NSQ76_20630 [Bacillus sp. FSL M8-0256]|uniref:hypothetical protein n=1 Tax=Bacillus TaxID=1386 RepID=UPI0013B77637|nr:hypothetical protein [Bacillus subtilis]KAF2423352.1 hypothetical protein B6K89_16135 [Bacillus subtilis]
MTGKKKQDQSRWKRILKRHKEEIVFLIIALIVLIVLIVGVIAMTGSVRHGLEQMNEQSEQEESRRYELVAHELNVSKKHLQIESRFFSSWYDVNADGDHYTVEFNDDYTKVEKIVKE